MRSDLRSAGQGAEARAGRYRAAIEMAAWVDARGCASIIVSEHHVADDNYLPSPIPLAAAIAAITTTTPTVGRCSFSGWGIDRSNTSLTASSTRDPTHALVTGDTDAELV